LAGKESGSARIILSRQLRGALKDVKIRNASALVIAYEPLWAIGTGHAIIPAEAEIMSNFLISEAAKILKKKVCVIYGGSVDLKNAGLFLAQKHISGLLVGGASLKEDFCKLCY
jgi:triosephosphate isomerase